jgi:hypothetical protein
MSVGAILGLAGGGLKAYGELEQADAQSRAYDYNANIAEENATQALAISAQNERRQRIQGKKEIGSMVAAYGASGVTTEGSPMEVLADSIANAELDALNVRFSGQSKAINLRNEAAYGRYQAREAKRMARISAAASLLGAGGKSYSQMPSSGGSSSSGYSGDYAGLGTVSSGGIA